MWKKPVAKRNTGGPFSNAIKSGHQQVATEALRYLKGTYAHYINRHTPKKRFKRLMWYVKHKVVCKTSCNRAHMWEGLYYANDPLLCDIKTSTLFCRESIWPTKLSLCYDSLSLLEVWLFSRNYFVLFITNHIFLTNIMFRDKKKTKLPLEVFIGSV